MTVAVAPPPRRSALARLLYLVLVAATFAPAARADRLVTVDRRILEPKKAVVEGETYRLTFEHGEIVCGKEHVGSVEIEGDMSDYVPQNDDEKKKLEQGYVRYRGKWLSKGAYELELKKQAEEARKRTDELAKHSEFHSGWVKETKHFEIRTNTSPELLERYANVLESFYDQMDQRFGIKPSPMLKRAKMSVNVYKNRKEFRELAAPDMSPGVAGFFSRVDRSLNFFHHYPDPAVSDWVALHECTHLLTFLIDPQFLPLLWINEGIADYMGAAEIQTDAKGKERIQPGRVQLDRVLDVQNAIAKGNYVKLEKLFRIESQDNFSAFEYAHAWSFVYFLNNSTDQYKKGFDRFFKDLYTRKGIKAEEVSAQGFDGKSLYAATADDVRAFLLAKLGVKDVAALEKEWLDFIKTVPIDAPKARFERADRYVSRGQGTRDQALDDIEAALEGGYETARAFNVRAMLRSAKGDRDGAAEDLKRAVALDPLNAGYRFALAISMSAAPFPLFLMGFEGVDIEVDAEGARLIGSKPELVEARSHFGLATELAPDNDLYKKCFESYVQMLEAHLKEEE